MRNIYLLIFAGTLTACTSGPPEKITKINALRIPVIQTNDQQRPVNAPHALSLYQQNNQQIESTAHALKSEYLDDVKTAEIFDVHSQAHQVYLSLSKLEQTQQLNSYYFKQHNIAGLQGIHESLKPLAEE